MQQDLAKKKIQGLIDKYKSVRDSGKLKSYTEEETKKDFILPLFEALGWNVFDKREVSAEESIKSGGRVDYGFYVNERIKFYLEAKPLRADLHREEYANQAIRYSWNRGVAWAVLTDFESLKVFCAQEIDKYLGDKLFFEIQYDDYVERFAELWRLSRESFQSDILDNEAEKVGKKLQKIPVSEFLYKDLDKARKILTDSLRICNKELSEELLDEGVQKLLNRIIFLRVAEDRGIEPNIFTILMRETDTGKIGKEGVQLYKAMTSKFRELDEIYNSNLFSKHPFEEWEEYGGATENAIKLLYGKRGYYEYDFKAMPADVLGSVYEHYLGYKSEIAKKRVVTTKDANKRKEQGIYYTPSFVVDFIVKNSLKPVLDTCKNISDLQKIKVLDPACGSGSFLIKALEVINDKYREFGRDGDQYTKIQILTENIYGVDLDPHAIEITRLNLLINALDSRTILPPLTATIKNGNSLISGTDEELKKSFGENWRDKKPFHWQEEFPEVFKQGGFDVVIGNPPYIKEFVNKSAFDGLHSNPYYQGKMDLWTLFACISIDLLKEGGIMSFIAPNNWISNAGASIFRNKILNEGELKTFIDFGDYKVFEHAGIQTMIFIFEKHIPMGAYEVQFLKINDKNITEDKIIVKLFREKQKIKIEPENFIDKSITFTGQESGSIFEKIEKKGNFELTEGEVGQGIVAAPDKYFLVSNPEDFNKNEQAFLKPFHTSTGRYKSGESKHYIFYICERNFKDKKLEDYPNIKKHFKTFERVLREAKKKYGTPGKPYFYLHRERNEKFFQNGGKIVSGVRVAYPSFLYTEAPYYGSRALNFIKTNRINLKYLTGILNSKVVFFWLKNRGKRLGDLLQIDKGPLLGIPIFSADKKQQKNIEDLVDEMLELNNKILNEKAGSNVFERLKTELSKTDKKIDDAVYKLYNLTQEEIKIVEE